MDIKEFLRAFAVWRSGRTDAATTYIFANYVAALEETIRKQDANSEYAVNCARKARELLEFANKLREVSLE